MTVETSSCCSIDTGCTTFDLMNLLCPCLTRILENSTVRSICPLSCDYSCLSQTASSISIVAPFSQLLQRTTRISICSIDLLSATTFLHHCFYESCLLLSRSTSTALLFNWDLCLISHTSSHICTCNCYCPNCLPKTVQQNANTFEGTLIFHNYCQLPLLSRIQVLWSKSKKRL